MNKCPRCKNLGSLLIVQKDFHGEKIFECLICGQTGRESKFPKMTVFDYWTTSSAALAERFVVEKWCEEKGEKKWFSFYHETEPNCKDEKVWYDTKQEAVHAVMKELDKEKEYAL